MPRFQPNVRGLCQKILASFLAQIIISFHIPPLLSRNRVHNLIHLYMVQHYFVFATTNYKFLTQFTDLDKKIFKDFKIFRGRVPHRFRLIPQVNFRENMRNSAKSFRNTKVREKFSSVGNPAFHAQTTMPDSQRHH